MSKIKQPDKQFSNQNKMTHLKIMVAALLFLGLHSATKAQNKSILAKPHQNLIINCAAGAGTFAAGKNMGGSAFLGTFLSVDWMPVA
jgi:hypothetical protein